MRHQMRLPRGLAAFLFYHVLLTHRHVWCERIAPRIDDVSQIKWLLTTPGIGGEVENDAQSQLECVKSRA
jgi:hypothetical protein